MEFANLMEYIKPELVIVAVALYIVGLFLKRAERFADKLIPLVLCLIGVCLALLWVLGTSAFAGWQDIVLAVFTALVQGVLVAGAAVLANQVYKQSKKLE